MDSEHDRPPVGTEVAGFQIVRRIAANVFEARRGDTRAVVRFEAGGDARQPIEHPCVTRTLATARRDDGTFVLVHDWIDGETLEARLADGPLAWSSTIAILRDLARGIGAFHAAQLVHGALTPSNILLPTSGSPSAVIVDLGSAVVAAPDSTDPRADLYALGVILERMLAAPAPEAAEDLCRWLLAKDPAQRVPNAHVLRLTLEALEQSPAPTHTTTEATA